MSCVFSYDTVPLKISYLEVNKYLPRAVHCMSVPGPSSCLLNSGRASASGVITMMLHLHTITSTSVVIECRSSDQV